MRNFKKSINVNFVDMLIQVFKEKILLRKSEEFIKLFLYDYLSSLTAEKIQEYC